MVSLPSASFLPSVSISAKLTGEFTSLEEPSDDYDILSIYDLFADGPGFAGSERQIDPSDPTRSLGFRLSNPYVDPCSRILA
jgi:hypothetical protein